MINEMPALRTGLQRRECGKTHLAWLGIKIRFELLGHFRKKAAAMQEFSFRAGSCFLLLRCLMISQTFFHYLFLFTSCTLKDASSSKSSKSSKSSRSLSDISFLPVLVRNVSSSYPRERFFFFSSF